MISDCATCLAKVGIKGFFVDIKNPILYYISFINHLWVDI